ncbi:trichohyalin-like [Montipora capricornis]|uniref:trichohyalin-like n=1 Tax=Montipora capricornis TaxID=246305 RepID=UPI0035F13D14
MTDKAETNEPPTAKTSAPITKQENNSYSTDGSTDSDSDSDTDFEEIEKEILGVKSMLRRYCGRHKSVAKLKSEHSRWLTSEATMGKSIANLEGSNINETIALVNQAEENERTRRMSIPFGSSDEQETDLDLSLANSQLSTVHQELLHLFAIHDAKYQMECERERRTVENTKMRMHEQLLSNMARRKARDIFEMEKKRKIEEMKRLTENVSEEGIAMAETNARLSQVHVDLKNAFQRMRDAKAAKEDNQRKESEEHKEMMLQEIRRRPTGKEQPLMEQERMRRQELYLKQLNERRQSHESLLQVQEQLLKIFAKLKREKKLKKIEMRQNQEDNKERMQEELVRKSLQKEVSKQEAHEKARRIKESNSQTNDDDDAKSKAIDMLVDVQKQLLDVFAIAKIQDVKDRMNHLKVMSCRQNMLHEIRNRRINQEAKSGFIKTTPSTAPATKQGRRLSLIGERFQLEVGNTSSQESSSK